MFGRLFLLFTVVTTAELFLLIKLWEWMGLSETLLLIVLTAIVGSWLARSEGLRVLTRVRAELARGRVPADAMLDGVAVLIAGALLITPGVLTDVVGLSLLIPFLRAPLKQVARARAKRWAKDNVVSMHVSAGRRGPFRSGGGEIIDVTPVDRADGDASRDDERGASEPITAELVDPDAPDRSG